MLPQNLQNNDLPYYVVPFVPLGGLWQGWPEKDQSGLNHPVLTGLNQLKRPNFDHQKWSKLKNLDFSEVDINKRLIYNAV